MCEGNPESSPCHMGHSIRHPPQIGYTETFYSVYSYPYHLYNTYKKKHAESHVHAFCNKTPDFPTAPPHESGSFPEYDIPGNSQSANCRSVHFLLCIPEVFLLHTLYFPEFSLHNRPLPLLHEAAPIHPDKLAQKQSHPLAVHILDDPAIIFAFLLLSASMYTQHTNKMPDTIYESKENTYKKAGHSKVLYLLLHTLTNPFWPFVTSFLDLYSSSDVWSPEFLTDLNKFFLHHNESVYGHAAYSFAESLQFYTPNIDHMLSK